MRIVIETVPHTSQRYATCGDYFTGGDGAQHISVSEMGNSDYEFLVALHELIEWKLCQSRGISDDAITKFDIAFERDRTGGDLSEPGDDPNSPYHAEHCIATGIERIMCSLLGIKWHDYDKVVLGLNRE